jgi:hypothetical protein
MITARFLPSGSMRSTTLLVGDPLVTTTSFRR